MMSYLAVWERWRLDVVVMYLAMLSDAVAPALIGRIGGGGVVFWFVLVVDM